MLRAFPRVPAASVHGESIRTRRPVVPLLAVLGSSALLLQGCVDEKEVQNCILLDKIAPIRTPQCLGYRSGRIAAYWADDEEVHRTADFKCQIDQGSTPKSISQYT